MLFTTVWITAYLHLTRSRAGQEKSLLISALGFVPDVRQAVTMDVKAAGSRLYLLGETRDEWGGSALSELYDLRSGEASTLREMSVPGPSTSIGAWKYITTITRR